jgi:hypothetical protein
MTTKEPRVTPTLSNSDPKEFYVIDTRTRQSPQGRDWQELNLLANDEYRGMMEDSKLGKLGNKIKIEGLPHQVKNRAANFHEPHHMTPETVTYKQDKGFIFIDTESEAKRVLDSLKKLDKDIELSPFGKQFSVV